MQDENELVRSEALRRRRRRQEGGGRSGEEVEEEGYDDGDGDEDRGEGEDGDESAWKKWIFTCRAQIQGSSSSENSDDERQQGW
eukprot:765624-Hanusia_phi.AAC.2